MKPKLEKINLSLPTKPIQAGELFKLDIEATGEGLPGTGDWLHIILKGKLLTDLIFTRKPKCNHTQATKSEFWQVLLQAPETPGSYDMKIVFWQIESKKNHIKTTLKVTNKFQPINTAIKSAFSLSDSSNEQQAEKIHFPARRNKNWKSLALWGLIAITIVIIGQAMIEDTPAPDLVNDKDNIALLETKKPDNSPPQNRIESVIKADSATSTEALKFQSEIEILQQQSMDDQDETVRLQAWQQLSQWMESLPDNSVLEKVKASRQTFHQETDQWFEANKNMPEVIIRLKVLTEVNDTNAQMQLAELYETGRGVDKHLGLAHKLYQKANKNGHPQAQKLLDKLDASADLLLNAKILAQRQFGYQLAELSAQEGNLNAQLWMAYRHEQGDGVAKNNQIATEWYRKAAAQGNPWAKEKLLTLQ